MDPMGNLYSPKTNECPFKKWWFQEGMLDFFLKDLVIEIWGVRASGVIWTRFVKGSWLDSLWRDILNTPSSELLPSNFAPVPLDAKNMKNEGFEGQSIWVITPQN